MEKHYDIREICSIVKGELIKENHKEDEITNLLIDSRKIISPQNSIFIALKGRTNNGHNYIEELYNKKVYNFIISEKTQELSKFTDANFIFVTDTLKALQSLCAAHRENFDIPVIGITGSNGKTIIKEWLYQLMCSDKIITRSPKSYNSQIGVPLSVWQINTDTELAIFEAGISEADEMEHLEFIIKPTIGIFTNIGEAHNENFINLKQKINEKLKLFTKVEHLIYCTDHIDVKEQIANSRVFKNINLFTWGRNKSNNLIIKDVIKNNNKTTIHGNYNNEDIDITIPFIDNASIENAIHCWACMLLLEYKNEPIAKRMAELTSVAMRLELKEGINNCTIINDYYNSDINSIAIAIDFLNQQKQHSVKTIILSDILQSGRDESYLYEEVSKLLTEKGINKIIGIGNAISKQAGKFNIDKTFFNSTEDFLYNYPLYSFRNETILLKGARIFKFELISNVLQQKAHETVLEINLNSIIQNLNYYRSLLKPDTKIIAMVKAFSYGSGSFEIANTLQYHNVDYLAVAYADEGIELRKSGINMPVMVMNPDEQSFSSIIKYELEPEIYNFRILNIINLISRKINRKINVHIKIDTGMHRLGFEKNDIKKLIETVKNNGNLCIKSVFSHLASSNDKKHDEFTKNQIKNFEKTANIIKSEFDYPILLHILNSAGIKRFNDAQFDMVRLGIGLYGISSDKEEQKLLKNVSILKTIISQIKHIKANETIGYDRKGVATKDTKIAVIPIGYADGINRKLGNGNISFIINGKEAPTIGNICMDMAMVDISDIPAKEGDDVIIFNEDYPITRISEQLGTIPYEILTSISARVKRIYFHE